jgi:hypothetical protein
VNKKNVAPYEDIKPKAMTLELATLDGRPQQRSAVRRPSMIDGEEFIMAENSQCRPMNGVTQL